MTFFEIDPEIVRIARDPKLFTYLADSDATIETVVGDGRLGLAKAEKGSFDLIVLDAFSSDAIPVHLLTEEAMRTYVDRLAPGGLLVVHISNRVFDLEPVLASAADRLGLSAVTRQGGGGADGATPQQLGGARQGRLRRRSAHCTPGLARPRYPPDPLDRRLLLDPVGAEVGLGRAAVSSRCCSRPSPAWPSSSRSSRRAGR